MIVKITIFVYWVHAMQFFLSCKRLLMLYSQLFLWNSSIKITFQILPLRLSSFTYNLYFVVIGFQFDSLNNDYKVVRVVNIRKNIISYKHTIKAKVYSFNVGCQKTISINLVLFQMLAGHWNMNFTNGFVQQIRICKVNDLEKSFVL